MIKKLPFSLVTIFMTLVALSSFLPFGSPSAQQPASDVAIDNDDIGGVVTGPKGPEAGVWVIAETRDLPVRYIKSVVTDDRGRFVVPDLPAANYQVWARGYGLVDSAKTTAKPGQRIGITAVIAPSEAAAAHYYPAIYWYSMLKIPAADQFGGKSSIPARLTQMNWISSMKNTGCIGCHQLGQQSTRTIPRSLGTFASSADAWRRRVQAGTVRSADARTVDEPRRPRVRQLWRLDRPDRQGRAAVCQAGTSTGRRAQYRRHAARLDERQAVPARPDCQRPPASQRSTPTDRSSDRPSTAPTRCRSSIPSRTSRPRSRHRCAMPSMPLNLGPGHAAALDSLAAVGRTGATSASGRRASTITTRCSGATAGCGWPPRCAARTIRPSASRDRITRRPGRSRWSAPSATSPCSIRRRRNTRSSRPASRRITCSSATTRTRRSGRAAEVRSSAGSTRRCSTRPATPRNRRDGRHSCSTPTATASATRTSKPRPAGRSGKRHADQLALLFVIAESGRRLHLGSDSGCSRRGRQNCAWIESAGDRAGRDLPRTAARLRRAGRRYR